MNFNYSAINNQFALDVVSNMRIIYFNNLLNFPYREDWEVETVENQIKAEKVFDL